MTCNVLNMMDDGVNEHVAEAAELHPLCIYISMWNNKRGAVKT